MRILRRILLFAGLVVGVLFLSLTISVFLFKDKIIRHFITVANKSINTPIKVGKIDVSMWNEFPQLSIVLSDVYIEDSHPGIYPLLIAKTISFQLDPVRVYNNDYTIKGLKIVSAEANLKINMEGVTNYEVTKAKAAGSAGSGEIAFDLQNVKLEDVRVQYKNLVAKEDMQFKSGALRASIDSHSDIYRIQATGDVTTIQIGTGNQQYLVNKAFDIRTSLVYNDQEKSLAIEPSLLKLSKSPFEVSGSYAWKTKNLIDVKIVGKQNSIQTLLSLLPSSSSSDLSKYKSKGDVYFDGHLKGEISKTKSPALNLSFGFRNTTIYHPAYDAKIDGATLTGSFHSGDLMRQSSSSLQLTNVSGRLNGEPFAGSFSLRNFDDPEIGVVFKGKLDAEALTNFFPVEPLKEVKGMLLADLSFHGKTAYLKKRSTAQKVNTKGRIELSGIQFQYGANRIPVKDVNGVLQFDKHDLALSNLHASLGQSDFLFNGFLKNVITFMLFENQPIGVEADLQSAHLDVDELLSIGFSNSNDTGEPFAFKISPLVYLNFNCKVASLNYKKFNASGIKGDLLVKDRVAVSRNLSFSTMGGNISLSGILDSQNPKAIDLMGHFQLQHVHLDSAFYVFENFNQDFVQQKHLKGYANADVDLELSMNEHLRLFPETLVSDVSLVIEKGELNQFEPFGKLSKFIKDEGLNKLRFAEIRNDIHIEDKTIFLPQMEVRSNVTTIRLSGRHTFDQQIEYHLVTPLRIKRTNLDSDDEGESKLYFKISGTTDNYRVTYDTEAVRKKIATDLKNEVKELKEAFQNKGIQKKKEVELQTEEYFDWDNDQKP